jgi:hypothetical protein
MSEQELAFEQPRKKRTVVENPRALYESMDDVCREYDDRLTNYGGNYMTTTKKANKRKNRPNPLNVSN